MSSTTWNSLLLSKGSIFSTTSCTTASDTDSTIASNTPNHSLARARPPVRGSSSGVMMRRNRASSFCVSLSGAWPPAAAPWPVPLISLPASQGVTTKATASEMNMPIDELIGIGLM